MKKTLTPTEERIALIKAGHKAECANGCICHKR